MEYNGKTIRTPILHNCILNEVANCGEKSFLFATAYHRQFPEDTIEVLENSSFTHMFVRIGDKAQALIVDPWANMYFFNRDIDSFLITPKEDEIKLSNSFDFIKPFSAVYSLNVDDPDS